MLNILGSELHLLDTVGRENVAYAVRSAQHEFDGLAPYTPEQLELIEDLVRLLILRQADRREWCSMGIACAADMGEVRAFATRTGANAIHLDVVLPAFIKALDSVEIIASLN